MKKETESKKNFFEMVDEEINSQGIFKS